MANLHISIVKARVVTPRRVTRSGIMSAESRGSLWGVTERGEARKPLMRAMKREGLFPSYSRSGGWKVRARVMTTFCNKELVAVGSVRHIYESSWNGGNLRLVRWAWWCVGLGSSHLWNMSRNSDALWQLDMKNYDSFSVFWLIYTFLVTCILRKEFHNRMKIKQIRNYDSSLGLSYSISSRILPLSIEIMIAH